MSSFIHVTWQFVPCVIQEVPSHIATRMQNVPPRPILILDLIQTPASGSFRLHCALAHAVDSHLLMRPFDFFQQFNIAGVHIHMAVRTGMANLILCTSEPRCYSWGCIWALSGLPSLAPIVLGDAGERHGDV